MARLYRLHALQIPLMRTSAYALLTLLTALYTSALEGRVNVRAVTQFGFAAAIYCALTWLALHFHYSRPLDTHEAELAFAFTLLDPFMIVTAIYLTGGDASWLFLLILLPIVSQSYLNGRRALVVAGGAAVAYLAMLLYAQRVDGATIAWPLVTLKLAVIGAVAFYCIGLGVIEERYRSRMIRALRDAKRDSEMRVAELASLNRVTRTAAGTLDVTQMLNEITSEVVALFNAAGGEIVLGACEEVPDARTIVAPLRSYGDTIGAMVVRAGQALRGPFTPEDRELAETIAGQIAGPVANARLYGIVQEASLRDALTGIANRRKFEEVLQAEWQRATREQSPVAALMIDVDAFKAYNDRYGHQRGDDVLRRVADQLRGCANGHLVARYGGEEFVVMACAPLPAAAQLAETMRASVESLGLPHEGSPSGLVTISIGVASAVPSEEPPASLLSLADARLYEAKRSGRNRVVA